VASRTTEAGSSLVSVPNANSSSLPRPYTSGWSSPRGETHPWVWAVRPVQGCSVRSASFFSNVPADIDQRPSRR
jgi:hypothetical protein